MLPKVIVQSPEKGQWDLHRLAVSKSPIKDHQQTLLWKALKERLEDYIEKHERGLITAIRNNTDNTIDNRMTKTRGKNGKENNSMGVLNDQ